MDFSARLPGAAALAASPATQVQEAKLRGSDVLRPTPHHHHHHHHHAHRSRTQVPALARFFPQAVPMRVPVRVSGTDSRGRAFSEHTTIEFGTPSEVLFSSALPFEHGDKLRITSHGGSFDVQASVVAARYHSGKTAVAARVEDPSVGLPIKKQ